MTNWPGTIKTDLPLSIGSMHGDYGFTGKIDDVRIYSRVITESEVKRIYEIGVKSVAGIQEEQRSPPQQKLLSELFEMIDQPLLRQRRELEEALFDSRRWHVNGLGQTMVLVPVESSSDHDGIYAGFAIASTEVTVRQYRQLLESYVGYFANRDADSPTIGLSWYSAVGFCNRLSEHEGIPKDQWVYEPNRNQEYAEGMSIKPNFQALSGYRLPTEKEWEIAGRSATTSSYAFGEPFALLPRYGLFARTSGLVTEPVASRLPNDLGLFDMHGSAAEFTQDAWDGTTAGVGHQQAPSYNPGRVVCKERIILQCDLSVLGRS